jgi:hypothetical protein
VSTSLCLSRRAKRQGGTILRVTITGMGIAIGKLVLRYGLVGLFAVLGMRESENVGKVTNRLKYMARM